MVHIYSCYKMCVLLSLFIRTKLFLLPQSVTPMARLLFRMSGICLFIPFVLPVVDVFHVPYFKFSTSDKYTRTFQKIRQQHVWHEIVSWDCRFNHVISMCRLCHCTAISGYHKYVRLKMDGLPEPWQTLKYEVCFDFCVWYVLHQ